VVTFVRENVEAAAGGGVALRDLGHVLARAPGVV